MDLLARLTVPVQLVLRALLTDPDRELYGLELVDETGLLPGSLYPIMARLESAGWVEGRWEVVDTRLAKRPRRRYYRVSADAVAHIRTVIAGVDNQREAGRRRRLRVADPATGGAV